MAFVAFISSIVGGAIVALLNHLLTHRHELLMKRELYRELVYRQQIEAYGKVYAHAASYVHQFKYPMDSFDRDRMKAMIAMALRMEQEIENCSLFMPDKIRAAIREIGQVKEEIIKNPACCAPELGLEPGAEISEDVGYLIAWDIQCSLIMDELRKDLSVETLSAGFGSVIGIKGFKETINAFWTKAIQKLRAKVNGD